MENQTTPQRITVEAKVNAPVEKVWSYWNEPAHVTKWNAASDDWHCPAGENNLVVGGSFSFTMAAKDGSFSFDFGGIYDVVDEHKSIAYTMEDGRRVEVSFTANGNTSHISETFDAETTNPIEMQQGGWQAILNNFKKYTEEN